MKCCNKGGSAVEKEFVVKQYPYYCPECYENRFTFETHEEDATKNEEDATKNEKGEIYKWQVKTS